MNFGQRLYSLRTERGWSQQYVADQLGLNKMSVSQYETGKRKPSFDVIEALADLFHVDMNYLLCHSDVITRPSGDETDDVIHDKVLAVDLEELLLIEAYRHASDDTKDAVRAVLRLKAYFDKVVK